MRKAITIQDIAKKVSASPATVSRVLSKSNYPVKAELRKKIHAVAKELNYTPNLLGRQLKTNNSMTVGVIVPSISNPFYSSVVLGVEEIARLNGYQILLCNAHQDKKLEEEYLQTLLEKQVKGVIISSISGKTDLLETYIKKNVCVISIDQDQEDRNIYQINFDYRKGGYMATKHLIENGHRKIAYITAPLDRPSRIGIYKGYLEALNEAKIEIPSDFVQISDQTEEQYYTSTYEFNNGKALARKSMELTERPTAILACNDMTALGVITELTAIGIRVPEDVSVIGFDNVDLAGMCTPSLTTIDHPKYEMGKFACKMLVQILNGESIDVKEVVLQPKLVIRNSTISR